MSEEDFQLWTAPSPKIECTCGTTITMQKDDHPMFHSDWCEVKKKWTKDEEIRIQIEDWQKGKR